MMFDFSSTGQVIKTAVLGLAVVAAIVLLIYGVSTPADNPPSHEKRSMSGKLSDEERRARTIEYCTSAIININSANRDNVAQYRAAKLRNAISNLAWACEYERRQANRDKLNDVIRALKYAVLVLDGHNDIKDTTQIESLWLIGGNDDNFACSVLSEKDIVPVDEAAYINNAILVIASVINNQ